MKKIILLCLLANMFTNGYGQNTKKEAFEKAVKEKQKIGQEWMKIVKILAT